MLRYEEEQPLHRSTEPRVPLGGVFGTVVALETAYVLLRSIASFVRLQTDYALRPVTVLSAVLFPLVFGWAAYVLWRPKFATSRREALLRSSAVWLVGFVNLLLVVALLDRPDMVIRSLF